ncbi:MAG: GNAT family N-acetyltransferase [Clostridia bacterium]|nr:GNAT family N-acetyltransferase [Clostridia bacterium]
MNKINTVDLWTEQHRNQFELFNGCFTDGFSENKIPFDKYKVVKNCNCIITSNLDNLPIGNKHNAIVFYKNNKVVRLLVAFKDTSIDFCLENALNQKHNGIKLSDLFKTHNIVSSLTDLNEEPIFNNFNLSAETEIDVGSCDRNALLEQMLKGSYTEADSKFGHYDNIEYSYKSNIKINYKLKTDEEIFEIAHEGVFINETNTRVIILQVHSEINFDEINGEIVKASKADLVGCAKILKDIYNSNVLSEGWTDASSLAICEFYFKLQPDLFYVAKKEGKVVGFTFSYIKPWADGNHLMVEEISVDPNFRKTGTAIKLISKVFETAIKKYKISKVDGTTYEDETGAPFKLYKKIGFKKVNDLFLIECDASKLISWF